MEPPPDIQPIVKPAAVPGDLRRLDPRIRTVWRLKRLIALLVLLLGVLLYDIGGLLGERALPTGVPTGIVLLLGLTYAIAIPKLRYRFWRYALREEELLIERGIWTRVRTVVPLRRIQHLDVSQDIFEREYELGRLIVHTAGTRSSDVVLPGLAIEEAEHLRDTIKHYVLEDTL